MSEHETSSNFYLKLGAFSDFSQVAETGLYHPLPDDWTLLVTDVVDSTGAVEAGKYKSVNMVGAASIIAVINVKSDVQLPFAFGGDGGLIAVPPDMLNAASTELKKLQTASGSLFGMELRAAAIPVGELRSQGADTRVRKFSLSKGNSLAMFAGAGPSVADQWLKEDRTSKGYALHADGNEDLPNLDNLSCRWEALTSRNGVMLTVILKPVEFEEGGKHVQAANAISQILGGRLSDFAPVHDSNLKFRLWPAGLGLEIAANTRHANRLRRSGWIYFTSLMQYFCERFGVQIGDYNGATYREELKSNTDYRKYDGALRMVLDVTLEQSAKILSFLEQEYKKGRLIYGTSQSKEALMTCLLFDLSASQHIHFIDGANGGYTMAAKDMKQRQMLGSN